MPGPLTGVRVLDLSRVMAGPWCSQILADLGAEVIKIEQPGRGDETRGWGPPWLTGGQASRPGDAGYFLSANRGKSSLAVDFNQPEGRQIIADLAAGCDVFLENFRTGSLAGKQLDYPSRTGSHHPNLAPYQPFTARDGMIIIAVGNDVQFRCLCSVLGRPEMAADERFTDNALRVKHRASLEAEIEAVTHKRTCREWIRVLTDESIPCGPVNTLSEVFAEPQVEHRRMQIELDHPFAGRMKTVANPIRFSATPIEYSKAPPLLGENTGEILQKFLGRAQAEVDALRKKGVIQ